MHILGFLEVFVMFHIKQHGKEDRLQPRDKEKNSKKSACGGNFSKEKAVKEKIRSKQHARYEQSYTHKIKKDKGMKITDNILLKHSIEKKLAQ